MPKYSIIVPVYNMSNFLPQCIESLKSQSYDDLEILLVDDCSTDNSYQICLNAANGDRRFRVIRQDRNRGLSATRNLGMKHAEGKYITFVDSDDYVESNFIAAVDEKERQYPYDMITWGMYNNVVYEDGHVEIVASSLNYPEEKCAAMATEEDWTLLTMDTFFASTCLRFYRLDIIREHSLEFDIHCVDFEDYIFNISYCRYARSFLIMKDSFYHYRQPYGQLATVKRKWSTVTPFDVSDRVFKATQAFFADLGYQQTDTKRIYLYVYKAYFNEIEYAYRTKKYRAFAETVASLTIDPSFQTMLEQVSETRVGRFAKLLRGLSRRPFRKLFCTALWLMERKDIGRVIRIQK